VITTFDGALEATEPLGLSLLRAVEADVGNFGLTKGLLAKLGEDFIWSEEIGVAGEVRVGAMAVDGTVVMLDVLPGLLFATPATPVLIPRA